VWLGFVCAPIQRSQGELQYEEFAVMWGSTGSGPAELPKGAGSSKKGKSAAAKKPQAPSLNEPPKARPAPERPGPPPKGNAGASSSSTASAPELGAASSSASNPDANDGLQGAAELDVAAAGELAAAEALGKRADGLSEQTFEARLGRALLRNEHAVASLQGGEGAHYALTELVREWDTNRDGDISKAELRQAVRGSLGLQASNKEIDRLFDDFDVRAEPQLDPAAPLPPCLCTRAIPMPPLARGRGPRTQCGACV
jgi:hypothetical protein